jgi:COX assembly mitochondrial protein 2
LGLLSRLLTIAAVGCEDVMNALEECHARGFLYKVVGGCNSQKTAVNKCLRAERLKKIAENREKAKAKREKVEAIWREVDENS